MEAKRATLESMGLRSENTVAKHILVKQPNSETKRGSNPNSLEEATDGSLCGISSRNNPFGLFSKSVAAFFDVVENVFLAFAYFFFQIFYVFEMNFLSFGRKIHFLLQELHCRQHRSKAPVFFGFFGCAFLGGCAGRWLL